MPDPGLAPHRADDQPLPEAVAGPLAVAHVAGRPRAPLPAGGGGDRHLLLAGHLVVDADVHPET